MGLGSAGGVGCSCGNMYEGEGAAVGNWVCGLRWRLGVWVWVCGLHNRPGGRSAVGHNEGRFYLPNIGQVNNIG